jgi:DNA polymerase-3 subunit gamma/tau
MARIFARAIGASELDTYEIDAASNRGIDDVRELKEAVHTLPYESPYKVYIIDEVHMLTKEAFNALLKTLEEPPAHVIFILATTEEEKLLDTILSRCQVFRFNSPSRSVLTKLTIEVAKKEGFTLSPEAADLIALAADGSFRDALGIVQKVILASGDTIGSADEVAAIIGAPRTSTILALLDAIHTKDKERALDTLATVTEQPVDIKLFSRLLLEHIRAVMLLRNLPSHQESILGAFGPEAQEKIRAFASGPSLLNSHTLLRLLSATELISRSPIPQLPLEIAVIDIIEG